MQTYQSINAQKAKELMESDDYYVIDVRNENEWNSGHIPKAHHHMLGTLENQPECVPKDKTLLVHCQAGARSAIGTSPLQSKGFNSVLNMEGGFDAWEKEGLPVKR